MVGFHFQINPVEVSGETALAAKFATGDDQYT